MAIRDQYKKINEQLIELLRDLLASGNWDASLFLRTAQTKLQSLLDQAVAISEQLDPNATKPVEKLHKSRGVEGYLQIYVSLYQSDAHNLVKWENTLKTIKEHSINRPIYRSEEHIQEMIRSKQGSPNEGYVIIYIKPSDIIQPYAGKLIEDRWGHELLTLRDNSLQPDNIVEFVHQGRRYEYLNGKLLLKSDSR